jgi:hypothetical protein
MTPRGVWQRKKLCYTPKNFSGSPATGKENRGFSGKPAFTGIFRDMQIFTYLGGIAIGFVTGAFVVYAYYTIAKK